MQTRAKLIVKNGTQYQLTLIHFDGSPEHMSEALLNYDSPLKAIKLSEYGDADFIDNNGEIVNPNNNIQRICFSINDAESILLDEKVDFTYFMKDTQWVYKSESSNNWKLLNVS